MGNTLAMSKEVAYAIRISAFAGAIALWAAVVAAPMVMHAQAPSSVAQSDMAADQNASQPAGPYLTWLDQDVRWIIAADERQAYLGLHSDEERLQFIKGFWDRRNPNPAAAENTFKEEHYRRLAYANTHFAGAQPGWTSDRGHIYIVYGPPDSIDAHVSSAAVSEPFEVWHYRALHGNAAQSGGVQSRDGSAFDFTFVDYCGCGDYKLLARPTF